MGRYEISKDTARLQPEVVTRLLHLTYWAGDRPQDVVERSIRGSVCYGAYDETGRQVGFARVVTDYATTYYLCDVVVTPDRRGDGVGKALVAAVTGDPELKGQMGILVTKDAHGLYEQYGFHREGDLFMVRFD